ncbi:putative methanogenesis marker protein 7 [Candidatus Methanoperedens nitroreducens]|uniref:Putative methanogenesis marker protein 7 n=1 Tax=Candidatus Methanoperedens nitratireducens TaxID=1392998 RepID=A0A062V7X5_9EURY|nr:methanogenesis marker 7 protein [Candidatus Methanoperedens nitroreducens]KCZ72683.1 putative methanogenesis marker protein 7 [Candidatus Methanoperedens nitroreducens]MDJ1423385.1 methanogenesis marker 7 protein [Candidatus Methanoperedens sp.]
MLEPVMYEGGVYKHNHMVELVEDLGGYILQKNVLQTGVVLLMLVPINDMEIVENKARDLLGKVTRAPLTGTEIATVAPTLAYHHLPHLDCDVAEFLRKKGAKTNMIGLARGVGKRICQITAYERDLINEHDVAVFVLGNYEHCIIEKSKRFYEGIEIPIIVTGAPELKTEDVPNATAYVGNFGRILHHMRHSEELRTLDKLADVIGNVLDNTRMEIAKDPLAVAPPRIKKEIEEQVQEIIDSLHPLPITLQMNGARVKLPYKEYHEQIENIKFVEGVTMKEVARVLPSKMRDFILIKALPRSETGFVI